MQNNRRMERSMKELHQFLAENATQDMSMDEINALMNAHIQEINAGPEKHLTEENAETADDLMDLAEDSLAAGNEQEAIRLARKAAKLDPENIDIEWFLIQHEEREPESILRRMQLALDRGRDSLQKQGFFEEKYIGEFWQTLETRPYMRLMEQYVGMLKELGMQRMAICEAEEMIRLNKQDNLGMRYTLMHLYALLEDAESAEKLMKQYSEHDECPMLLGLTLLYYKLGETDPAEKALRRLTRINKETRAFIRDALDDNLERKIKTIHSKGGYSPFTEEELIVTCSENFAAYESVPLFFRWMSRALKMK